MYNEPAGWTVHVFKSAILFNSEWLHINTSPHVRGLTSCPENSLSQILCRRMSTNMAYLVEASRCHSSFSNDATPGTNSALVLQLLSCGPCWMTPPETSGADVPALIEHRHRMVVRACSCGWEGWVRQGQMGCWWLPSLLVVYAEMTARSLPGQLQKQTGLTGHQLTCPLLLPRVQVKGESLCTPLILSTWQDPAVPHPALCRENFWKIIPVKKKCIKVKITTPHINIHNIHKMGYI